MEDKTKPHHPVYSDFSHMASKNTDIGSLTFAVGLREENPEEMVAKILPLTKIVPGEVKVRSFKKPAAEKHVEEKICSRPECVARRDRYEELNSENEPLRQQLKSLEAKFAASKNKTQLTEKSIQMAEEKNENLRGQIEDAQARIFTLEAEVEKGDQNNQGLRSQLANLVAEIDRLKQETQSNLHKLTIIQQNNSGPGVVFSKGPSRAPAHETDEVRSLSAFHNNENDSDDD